MFRDFISSNFKSCGVILFVIHSIISFTKIMEFNMISHSFLTPLLLTIEFGLVVGGRLVSFSVCGGGFAVSCDRRVSACRVLISSVG
jgi:hypothetical protein